MNTTIKAIAIAGGLLLVGTTAAVARDMGPRHAFFKDLVEDLALDESQTQGLQELKTNLKELKSNRPDPAEAVGELLGTIDGKGVDRDQAHAVIDTRMNTFSQALHTGVDEVLDFVETLEPSQRELLVDRLEEGADKVKSRHGRRGHGQGWE